MKLIRFVVIGLVALSFAGCLSTNVSEMFKALSGDPAANCVSVGTVYGTVTMARGTPETAVTVSGGNCAITGSRSANNLSGAVAPVIASPVMVPVHLMVVPTPAPAQP